MLKGKVKEIPIDRIPDLRNYRHSKFVIDPSASVAYLVKDIDVAHLYVSKTPDPSDPWFDSAADLEGTYNALIVPVLTKQGGHSAMTIAVSQEGSYRDEVELFWIRRWQDKGVAEEVYSAAQEDLDEQEWEGEERQRYPEHYASTKKADVDAVRGTAFNIARMLRGKLKEIPVERIPGYRSYYKGQPHLDPAASVMYLVRDVEADFEYEPMRGPMDDPQKDRTYEDSGVFNILFYPILNNQGVQGIEWQIGGEGEMPWSDLYDQDRRMRRWQDRDIAQEIKQSLYRYASGMRTAPLRTVVPPSFDSNQWRYFKGPAKTLARAWREKKDPPWHLVDRTIKIFEDYQYLREKPGWEDNEQTVSIMDALDKLRDYRDKLYPQGKPKKRKMSPGKILAEMMTDPAIVAMVRKLTPFFKRKPAEAAMFASEVLEDANFHSDNRLFNVAMADYDRDAVPLSYSDVAMKLRWDSRVLPFAAALLIAAGAKGAARSMLKKWGDNNKDWLLQNA
jgi:hypothetical protein